MIELRHVSKTYGRGQDGHVALDDISLVIEKGDIFGILGASGAGKSKIGRAHV